MLRGTVKWFNKTKGYGFIAQANGEKDVFVHITQVQKIGLKTLTINTAPNIKKTDVNNEILPCMLYCIAP